MTGLTYGSAGWSSAGEVLSTWLFASTVLLNPNKPGVPFLGHMQTVQTQIRRRRGSTLFAHRISYKNMIKMKKVHPTPLNKKWTRPIEKDWEVR